MTYAGAYGATLVEASKLPAIGTNVSSGCIRLTNEDIVDLYNRTPIGAKVIVFGTGKPAAAAQ